MSELPSAAELVAAVERLRAQQLVAFPTETVWGLGADAREPEALRALQRWKGRAPDQAISVLVPSQARAAAVTGCPLPAAAEALAEAFWPGPVTLIVPARTHFAPGVLGEGGALGLRCSPHPVAAALVAAADEAGLGPLTATSLNRSGEPAAATLAEARALCSGGGAAALVADPVVDASGAAPSSVVDCSGPRPRLLREGAVARDRLVTIVGPVDG